MTRVTFVSLVLSFAACGSPPQDGPLEDAMVRDGGQGDGSSTGGPDATPSRDADVERDADTPPPPVEWSRLPWEDCEGAGRSLEAGPDDYRAVLDTLDPGDTLRLRPGEYARGLPMRRSGEEGRCIVVEALDRDDRPVFLGSDSFNVLAVHGASWIKLRHLEVDGRGRAGFGVASQGGTDMPTHHVVIEDIYIHGQGGSQQTVGISTKSPAWDWVIRGNRIEDAGTGLYLGNSDGRQPFIRGVVEFNTVVDPIGYCMQIKHQIERPELAGIPAHADTIIRHNVFAKGAGASTGGSARPNLLLGHFPSSGAGADDRYLVYGNFLYDNATENLLQAEGNLVIFNNVFVNPSGGAITIQRHNGTPREVDVFFNTILASGRGLRISGGDAAFSQRARYNAIFAGDPLTGGEAVGNVTGALADAADIFTRANASPGEGLDLRPVAGALEVDAADLPDLPAAARDYDGRARTRGYAGAYAGPPSEPHAPLVLVAPSIPD